MEPALDMLHTSRSRRRHRSQNGTVTAAVLDVAQEDPGGAPQRSRQPDGRRRSSGRRRRLIDYPRAGRRGLRRWMPSLRLISELVLSTLLILVGACAVIYHNVRIPNPDQGITMQAAAQAYIGRDVSGLDVAQAAYLGAIIQAPSAYDPVARPEVLPVIKARWTYVVHGMVTSGWLSAAQAKKLTFPQLQPLRQHTAGDQTPYLMSAVESPAARNRRTAISPQVPLRSAALGLTVQWSRWQVAVTTSA
jgi:hypothetical protein